MTDATRVQAAPKWDERIAAKIQRVRADVITHGETCRDCPLVDGPGCETAETLWKAYCEAVRSR